MDCLGLEGAKVGVELESSTLLDREVWAVPSTLMGAPNWTGIPADDMACMCLYVGLGEGLRQCRMSMSMSMSMSIWPEMLMMCK